MTDVPVQPRASAYLFPDPSAWPVDNDLVATGADLQPGTLIEAYSSGLFPMPHREGLLWFSPVRRGVLPLDGMHLSRSLRRTRKQFEVTVNREFAAVIRACADRRRPDGWITRPVIQAYEQLHRMGWAHSVEVWREGVLAGGLYGVQVGGLFCAESKFSRVSDASKSAVAGLVDLLGADGDSRRVLDVQWRTDHLARLGVVEIPRAAYLAKVKVAVKLPPVFT